MHQSEKALLIYPPTGRYMRDDRCQAPVLAMTAQPPRIPLDLAYIAATLEQIQVECHIKDYPHENRNWEDLKKDLQELNPNYLLISTITPTLEHDMIAAKLAKELNPEIITMAKGTELIYDAKSIIKNYPSLNIAIRDNYEFTVQKIAKHIPLLEIPGITYRMDSEVVSNPDSAEQLDLNQLPLPARNLLKNELYKSPDSNQMLTLIETSRGCPNKCIYCAVSIASGYHVRFRTVESVIAELKECYFKYQIKEFFFRADTFTLNKTWVIDFCNRIVQEDLKIRWGTNSRVDTLCEERIAAMKKAGCYVIGFGIESGDQNILNLMKKEITLEQVQKAIDICKKYHIKTYALFLLGLPWETQESANRTIQFAIKLDTDFADFNIAYPLPGTEYWKIACQDNLFSGSLTGFDYGNPVVKTYHLSTEELINLRKKAIGSFYLRPKYILKTLVHMRSIKELFSYIKYGFRLISSFLLK